MYLYVIKLPVCVNLCTALCRSVLSNTICPYIIFTQLTLQGKETRERRGLYLPVNRTLPGSLLTLKGHLTQNRFNTHVKRCTQTHTHWQLLLHSVCQTLNNISFRCMCGKCDSYTLMPRSYSCKAFTMSFKGPGNLFSQSASYDKRWCPT